MIRAQRGNYGAAVDAFGKALALDAGFEPAQSNLARATQLAAIERAAS